MKLLPFKVVLTLTSLAAVAVVVVSVPQAYDILSLGDEEKGTRNIYRVPDDERQIPIADRSAPPPREMTERPKRSLAFKRENGLIPSLVKANNGDKTPNKATLKHTSSYIAITTQKDITTVLPRNLQQAAAPEGSGFFGTLQGSSFFTRSSLFRSSSIDLEPKRQKNGQEVDGLTFITTVLQPTVIPAIDEDYQLFGKCTVTNGQTLTSIKAHSCFYDVCLGGTDNCLNVYAGGTFRFSPFPQASGRGVFANSQNNGFLDPIADDAPDEDEDRVRRDLQNQVRGGNVTPVEGLESVLGGSEDGFSVKALRSALPPSFPGFCIGGTGIFVGITCSFEIITIAQRTIFPVSLETTAPTASPTETDEPTLNNVERELLRNLGNQEEENDKEGAVTATTKATTNNKDGPPATTNYDDDNESQRLDGSGAVQRRMDGKVGDSCMTNASCNADLFCGNFDEGCSTCPFDLCLVFTGVIKINCELVCPPPTKNPTANPTKIPTANPTKNPTSNPTTAKPTNNPTTAKPTSGARAGEDPDTNNGVIVQKIFISSNQRLPLGPRAVAGPEPTITKAT